MLKYHSSYTGRLESTEFLDLIDAAEALEKPISAPVLVGCLEFIIDLLKKVNNDQKTHELPRRIIERKLGKWQADAEPRVLIDLYLKHGQLLPAEDPDGNEVLRSPEVEHAEEKIEQKSAAARARWDQEKSTSANAKVQKPALPNGKGENSTLPNGRVPANAGTEKPPQTTPRSLAEIMHKCDHLSIDE